MAVTCGTREDHAVQTQAISTRGSRAYYRGALSKEQKVSIVDPSDLTILYGHKRCNVLFVDRSTAGTSCLGKADTGTISIRLSTS